MPPSNQFKHITPGSVVTVKSSLSLRKKSIVDLYDSSSKLFSISYRNDCIYSMSPGDLAFVVATYDAIKLCDDEYYVETLTKHNQMAFESIVYVCKAQSIGFVYTEALIKC